MLDTSESGMGLCEVVMMMMMMMMMILLLAPGMPPHPNFLDQAN